MNRFNSGFGLSIESGARLLAILDNICEPCRLAEAKTKAQISIPVTANLISAFVFATWIVQFLYLLNPKFPASSHLPSVAAQAGSWQTWSETPKTAFLASRLMCG